MKKFFVTAMAVSSFFIASAQNNDHDDDDNGGGGPHHQCDNCEVSKTPYGKAEPVSAKFDLRLKVHNIICLSPRDGGELSATVDKASQLDDGSVDLSNPAGGNRITFTVNANSPTKVSFFGGPVTYSGPFPGGPVANPFWLKLQSSDPDVTVSSVAGGSFQLGNLLNAAQINAGADNDFYLTASAHVGWTSKPGVYSQTNTVYVSVP